MYNTIFFLILIIPVTGFILEHYLEYLNSTMWSDSLTEKLKGIYDEKEYRKTQLYQKDNRRLSFWSSSFNISVIVAIILLGGFSFIDGIARSISMNLIIIALIFF